MEIDRNSGHVSWVKKRYTIFEDQHPTFPVQSHGQAVGQKVKQLKDERQEQRARRCFDGDGCSGMVRMATFFFLKDAATWKNT